MILDAQAKPQARSYAEAAANNNPTIEIVTTPPPVHTHDKVKSKAKTYVEATSSNSTNFNFEPISNILSQFVTQLLPHYPTNFTFIDTLKLITI